MRIFNRSAILHYAKIHADSRQDLLAWYADAASADWGSPQDVKGRFPAASIIANNRVVFDICGNRYRLIVSFNYRHRAGYIKFFGTHAQYEKIDARSVDTTGVSHGKTKRKH